MHNNIELAQKLNDKFWTYLSSDELPTLTVSGSLSDGENAVYIVKIPSAKFRDANGNVSSVSVNITDSPNLDIEAYVNNTWQDVSSKTLDVDTDYYFRVVGNSSVASYSLSFKAAGGEILNSSSFIGDYGVAAIMETRLVHNSTLDAQDLDEGLWNKNENLNIESSTQYPHITVYGSGDGEDDYYKFEITDTMLSASNNSVLSLSLIHI